MNSTSGVTGDRLADSSIVANRRQIALLLGRILQSRSLLSVGSPGKATRSSLLLELAPLRGYLLIDEPFPPLSLTPGSPIAVNGKLDGGHFSFTTLVEAPDMSSSGSVLQLRLPERLLYRERRGDFRLGLPPRLNLAPSEFVEDGQRFRGRLTDLSRQGAATLVHQQMAVAPGMPLSCLLHLPHTSLRATAEVRSLSAQLGQLRLGLRLLELSPADDALLSMEINALQRLALRARN
jgi:hypothetical protein